MAPSGGGCARARLVALVPVAAVQTHSVSECVGSLHEGAPTLLAVVPHLHPSGLELLPEQVRALRVCCANAESLCRDRAQSIAVPLVVPGEGLWGTAGGAGSGSVTGGPLSLGLSCALLGCCTPSSCSGTGGRTSGPVLGALHLPISSTRSATP